MGDGQNFNILLARPVHSLISLFERLYMGIETSFNFVGGEERHGKDKDIVRPIPCLLFMEGCYEKAGDLNRFGPD